MLHDFTDHLYTQSILCDSHNKPVRWVIQCPFHRRGNEIGETHRDATENSPRTLISWILGLYVLKLEGKEGWENSICWLIERERLSKWTRNPIAFFFFIVCLFLLFILSHFQLFYLQKISPVLLKYFFFSRIYTGYLKYKEFLKKNVFLYSFYWVT